MFADAAGVYCDGAVGDFNESSPSGQRGRCLIKKFRLSKLGRKLPFNEGIAKE